MPSAFIPSWHYVDVIHREWSDPDPVLWSSSAFLCLCVCVYTLQWPTLPESFAQSCHRPPWPMLEQPGYIDGWKQWMYKGTIPCLRMFITLDMTQAKRHSWEVLSKPYQVGDVWFALSHLFCRPRNHQCEVQTDSFNIFNPRRALKLRTTLLVPGSMDNNHVISFQGHRQA